jgi:hypothetical protein
MHADRPRCFRKSLQVEILERFVQPQRDDRALDEVGRLTGVEVEDDRRRLVEGVRTDEERMQFDRG